MLIEDLLLQLGGTTPMDANPTPGLTAATRLKGFEALAAFTPSTYAESHLIEMVEPLFGRWCERFTAVEHRRFRAALYEVYREQDFTQDQLRDSFPDFT